MVSFTGRNENEQSQDLSPISRYLRTESPGDLFVSLADRYHGSINSPAPGPPIDVLERDFAKAGIPGLPTLYEEQPFVGLRDQITINPRPRYVGSILNCAINPSTLRETRLPIHIDRTRAGSVRSITRLTPSIFSCIRKVLSSKPSFASGVIAAIHQLPSRERDPLVEHDATDNTDYADGSSTGTSRSYQKDSKRRRTSRNISNKSRGKEPPDDDEVGGGGRDGDGASSSSTQGCSQNEGHRWICPYCLAYPEVYWIPHLSDCSPGNMVDPNEWRSHLETHHSPDAMVRHLKKNKGLDGNQIGKFYMDRGTLDAVLWQINTYNKRRPRGPEKNKYWTDLFIKVWYMIFPKDKFPDFNEPLSAFHCEDMNLGDRLASQAEILLGAMYDTKADEAIKSGSPNVLPTAAEAKEYMAKAIAIMLLNEPAATGPTQWLARASPEAMDKAGQQYGARPVPGSMADSFNENPPLNDNAPAVNPAVADTSHLVPNAGRLWPIQLFPNGTWVELLPCNSTYTQEACLSLSPNWYVARTCPAPSPLASMMSPLFGSPFYAAQPDPTQQVNWDPSIQSESHDVSLQAIEGGPPAPQDFTLL
ncbi:hypothetical protein NW768_004137 [Fusarium equiseti]|uniref:Uncharacterized protein n=1 Tax=Fusarium equiseti TaxID=61235 RepID=A0ABQ8RJP6_FUSEQ|nr:hypothetical protein NW768_004137 [Fusarium equiseti]